MATYNTRKGSKINKPFQENVHFVKEGLKNCSIVIKGVTRRDETCYKCLFNTYPDGAIIGRICLKVEELYEPILLVTKPQEDDPKSRTVLCSATGHPAPELALNVSDSGNLRISTIINTPHPNGTVTVTLNANIVASSLSEEIWVSCEVSQHPHNKKQISVVIPAYRKGQAEFNHLWIVIGVSTVACLTLIFSGILWYYCKRRRYQNSKTPTLNENNVINSLMSPLKCVLPQKSNDNQSKPLITDDVPSTLMVPNRTPVREDVSPDGSSYKCSARSSLRKHHVLQGEDSIRVQSPPSKRPLKFE